MRVAITSRKMEAAKQAAALLTMDASRKLALQSDVSSLASETSAVKAVTDHFGQLDVLVANAGVGHFASIEDLTEADWKEMIDTNLTGVFNSVKASINALKASK